MESLQWLSEKFALGKSQGSSDFPKGRSLGGSLMTLGNSLWQIFPDNHCKLSNVYTRGLQGKIFPWYVLLLLKTV